MKAQKMNKPQYRHITISGLPGSGSTTLLHELTKELPDWQSFSGGEFMRAYALEKKLFNPSAGEHHDSTHYEDDFDRKVDMGMRETLEKRENYILESWLSGFLAQQVPGVLKVLLTCQDSLRVDRIVNRDDIPVSEAKKHIFERENNNRQKWARMYRDQWAQWVVTPETMTADQPIDFWHPNLYDLVIDTYSHSKEETFDLVWSKLHQK